MVEMDGGGDGGQRFVCVRRRKDLPVLLHGMTIDGRFA